MEYDAMKEILKVMDEKSESENANSEVGEAEVPPGWNLIPENVLIQVFKLLPVKDILACSEVSQRWNFIAYDDLLWKTKFKNDFKIEKKIPRKPGESERHPRSSHSTTRYIRRIRMKKRETMINKRIGRDVAQHGCLCCLVASISCAPFVCKLLC